MTTDCRYEAQVPPTVTLEAFVEAALALADDYEAILGMVGSQDPDRRRRLEVLRAGEAGFVDAEAYTQAARELAQLRREYDRMYQSYLSVYGEMEDLTARMRAHFYPPEEPPTP